MDVLEKSFIKKHEFGTTLKIKVTPKATKNQIVGVCDDSLIIKLASVPIEGKANKALVKFLGKTFNVPPSSIIILFGNTSRDKLLLIRGLVPDQILSILSL